MSLGEDMMNLSLSATDKSHDPVADATRRGKIPTLGEVKRSLKVSINTTHARYHSMCSIQALVKNLIQATTQMDALPSNSASHSTMFFQH